MAKLTVAGNDRRSPATYLLLIVVGFAALAPFLYAVVGSLRTSGQISADPLGFPTNPAWSNYAEILSGDSFWRPLLNSLVIAFITTALVVVCGALATFALARIGFRGRESVYSFFTLGLLFPAAVAILPLYLMLRQLHLLDSPFGVALPQAAFALPVTIVILRPFFHAIPKELEEAASMDGAGPLRFFWRILLPISVPALITVAILALIGSWNNYLLPLLLLTSEENWTLPLGIAQFAGTFLFDTAKILAYTVLAMVPTIVAYGFGERYIVQGLTAGAVKG